MQSVIHPSSMTTEHQSISHYLMTLPKRHLEWMQKIPGTEVFGIGELVFAIPALLVFVLFVVGAPTAYPLILSAIAATYLFTLITINRRKPLKQRTRS